MALKQCSLSAANIKLHPHSPEKYLQLFKDIQKLKLSAKVFGDTKAVIARSIIPLTQKENELEGIYGEISKYTDIAGNSWLNLQTALEADVDDLKGINIPDHIKPNYAGFLFIFFPRNHLFFFETRDGNKQLSPKSLEKFLNTVFSHRKIIREYGKIDVTIIPESDKVEEILRIHDLRRLTIEVDRPNPGDDLAKEEEELLKELDDQNIGKQVIKLTAVKGEAIKPSDKTATIARIAAQNGHVAGSGYAKDGSKIDDSTKKHPMIHHSQYDDKQTTLLNKLTAMAGTMTRLIRKAP